MKRIYAMTNGGLFASGKRCRNRRLGVFDAYATNHKRCVVLRYSDRIVVVTPDAPTAFVEAIRDQVAVYGS